jgi:hypothetical protein
MARTLGFRTAVMAIDNTGRNPYGNGFWVGTIDPKTWSLGANQFEVYHIAVRGPSGSTLELWVDTMFYSTTVRGDLNEWDPKQTLHMTGGQTLYFFWNLAGATTPLANVWIREPNPI